MSIRLAERSRIFVLYLSKASGALCSLHGRYCIAGPNALATDASDSSATPRDCSARFTPAPGICSIAAINSPVLRLKENPDPALVIDTSESVAGHWLFAFIIF